MPNVIFYREEDGSAPMLDWLDRLPQKARVQCIGKIELLKARGHELRRRRKQAFQAEPQRHTHKET